MKLFPLFCRTDTCEERFEQIRPRLFRMACSWCHNSALADDLVQDTLIKGMKNLAQLEDSARFNSWMFSILANCWHDHFRQHKEMDDIDDFENTLHAPDASPEDRHVQSQIVTRVRNAIAKLPVGQRQVVSLVDLEEFSYIEVSTILSIPIGTVMSRLCRARQSLQLLLKELEPNTSTRFSQIRRIK